MADRYLKSGAAGGADGTSWADAYTTLAAAFAGSSAGDRIWVSDAHAETQASAMTLTSPGTAASPVQVICVDDSAEPPTARATTATISTTGANAISFAGFAYAYGVTFKSASDAGADAANINFTSSSPWHWKFETCEIGTASTATAAFTNIMVGATTNEDAQYLELLNSTIRRGNSAQDMRLSCRFTMTGGSLTGTAPTNIFQAEANRGAMLASLRGVDLSAATGTIIDGTVDAVADFSIENCKLGAGVTVMSSPTSSGGARVTLVNSDSADTNYRYHKQNYQGTVTQETTIKRTGGATDGTTPISRKMVSTANSKIYSPLEGEPIVFWNESLAEQTVTVQVVTDNVTLTDAEAWIDVEYLGTSGFPLGVTGSDRISDPIFGTPANQTTSTVTWTTTGLTTPVKQALAVTFTAAEKGWVRVTPKLAKASTTMYYCPKVATGSRQWMTPSGIVNERGGAFPFIVAN